MSDNELRIDPPADQINRLIARALGWRIITQQSRSFTTNRLDTIHSLIDPKGNTVYSLKNGTVSMAWQRGAPNWRESIDAIDLELPQEVSFTISWEYGEYYAEINKEGHTRPGWPSSGNTRAEALAYAFLSFLENPDGF